MGRDKALLVFGSMTLLEQVVETVRAVAGTVLVVADRAERYALPEGVRALGDRFPGAGPLGGIVTGLEAAEMGYHLVTACDMPLLQPALLHLLLAEAEGRDGAIPEVGGQLEPLCAVYHSRCAERLRACLETGTRAVHRAVQVLDMKRIGEETLRRADPALISFTNINTPEDLARIPMTADSPALGEMP